MEDVDALAVENGRVFETDICVIGGGAAGIALATSFIGTRFRVILVESGDHSFDDRTQSLYEFDSIGHPLRAQKGYVSRNRYLGGSTNTWQGQCAPLNAIDFEARDWVRYSGWPFEKAALEPYYVSAAETLQLPDYEYFRATRWRRELLGNAPEFLDDGVLAPELFLLRKRPLNMRLAYHKALRESGNVQILLNANVTEIEPNESVSIIEKVHVATLDGRRLVVRARSYVLACGGWENARILLLSRRRTPQGLGNHHDVVGRYYMEHPKILSGRVLPGTKTLRSPIMFWKRRVDRKGFLRLYIRLDEAVQRREGLLNHSVELTYPHSLREAIISAESLMANLRFSRSFIHELIRFSPYVFRIADGIERMTLNLPVRFEHVLMFNHMEQEPDRESRVSLGPHRDALGLQRLQVNLRVNSREKADMVRFHEILRQAFAAQGLGEVVSEFPEPDEPWPGLSDSSHHMGTTRMSRNPRMGVVDGDCKLHGVGNLYIVGSSVFPSGGHVNPTLTIVALALRLGAHLRDSVPPG